VSKYNVRRAKYESTGLYFALFISGRVIATPGSRFYARGLAGADVKKYYFCLFLGFVGAHVTAIYACPTIIIFTMAIGYLLDGNRKSAQTVLLISLTIAFWFGFILFWIGGCRAWDEKIAFGERIKQSRR
jgi:hypothetical protein